MTARDSTKAREAFFLTYAEEVRAHTRIPLMLTGGFRTRAGMDEALESNAIDVVGMARPLAVEPDLPARLLTKEAEAATPVRLSMGIKTLDDMIQGGWYQTQIRRMANGDAPKLGMSRLVAVWRYLFPTSVRADERSRPDEPSGHPHTSESSRAA